MFFAVFFATRRLPNRSSRALSLPSQFLVGLAPIECSHGDRHVRFRTHRVVMALGQFLLRGRGAYHGASDLRLLAEKGQRRPESKLGSCQMLRVRMSARLCVVLCVASSFVAATNVPASATAIDSGAAVRAARNACWEGPGPVGPVWRTRIDHGHFSARLGGNTWHIQLVESAKSPKCPVIDATVTTDGNTVTCTITPCYTSS